MAKNGIFIASNDDSNDCATVPQNPEYRAADVKINLLISFSHARFYIIEFYYIMGDDFMTILHVIGVILREFPGIILHFKFERRVPDVRQA